MKRILLTATVTVVTFLGVNVLAQSTPTNPVFNPNTPGQPGPNDVRTTPPNATQSLNQTTGTAGLGGIGGAGGGALSLGTGGFGGAGGFGGQGGFGGNGPITLVPQPNAVPYGAIPPSPTSATTKKYDPLAPIDHKATEIDHTRGAIDSTDGGF